MISWRAILAVVVMCFALTTTAFCADALMGRYDARQTSYTPEKLDPPLKLSWEYVANKYDNNPAAPAVADGTVYFACGDHFYAVDLDTGGLKWKYPVEGSLGGMVKSAPAIFRDKVYFGAGDGNLYCLDSATGTFQWAYQTRGAIRCPPVIDNGVIYVGSDDNSVYGIQAESGDAAWKPFTANDDIAVGVAVGAGMTIAACMDGNLYGISSSSGKLRWLPFRLPQAPTDSSPVITESTVVMAVGNMMYGLTVRSGQMRWSVTLPSDVAATPAVDGADIYVPCKDKKMYAYTAIGRQVAVKWTEPAELDATPMSSPTMADQMIYVGMSRGTVAAYSAVDGSLKWRYAVSPSQVNSPGSAYTDAACSPVVADGALLVLTDDGVLHCFTQTAADNDPPIAVAETPTPGKLVSPAPPLKMSAVLYDIGSGVDFSTATLYLDDKPQQVDVDYSTFTVSYTTEVGAPGKATRADLATGVHKVKIVAKDYAGNTMQKEWYFVADPGMTPPKKYLLPTDQPAGRSGNQPKTRPTPPSMPTVPDRNSRYNRRGGSGGGFNMETPPAPPMPGGNPADQPVPGNNGGYQPGPGGDPGVPPSPGPAPEMPPPPGPPSPDPGPTPGPDDPGPPPPGPGF